MTTIAKFIVRSCAGTVVFYGKLQPLLHFCSLLFEIAHIYKSLIIKFVPKIRQRGYKVRADSCGSFEVSLISIYQTVR